LDRRLEAGWASELVWTQRLEEKSFASAGDRTAVLTPDILNYRLEKTQN
jgi:hypothetical protein